MYYLVLETSSAKGLLSILTKEKVVLSREVPFGVRESGELVPILDQALSELGLQAGDLAGIVLGIGPGSFTGLRIGASVAKAISFAKKIPIIGVSSLKGFEPSTQGPFGVLLDAKLHGIYLQKGERIGNEISYEEDAKLYSTQALIEKVKDLPYLLTTQKEPIEKKLADASALPLFECTPSPMQMLKAALSEPLENHLQAQDKLNLTYFDTRT